MKHDAPGTPNAGVPVPSLVGAKIGKKPRKGKGGKKSLKLAGGVRSTISNPPTQGGFS